MRHSYLCIVAVYLACAPRAMAASAQAAPISEETSYDNTRLRTSLAYYKFNINHQAVTGQGPDFHFEWAIGERWNVGAGIAQVYSYSGSMQTLLTEIEGGLWYSVWGTFPRAVQRWKAHGDVVVSYRRTAQPGLRLGLSLQQYFFNTSKAAVPFSGIAVRSLYELGLPLSFDLGFGVEAGRLSNTDSKAQSVKLLMSIIWPFAAG